MTVFQQNVHKYLAEVLKEKYQKNSRAVERVSAMLLTRGDVEEFLSMVGDIYKTGFERATDSYKDQLKKLGYNVKVTQSNDGV